MDNSKVIRVHIDRPPHSSSTSFPVDPYYSGFLGAELAEAETVLQNGGHLGFGWPMWASKAKETFKPAPVPQPATPENMQFQMRVQADMERMITLLDAIANMMANPSGQGGPPTQQAAPAALPIIIMPTPPVRQQEAAPLKNNTGSIYAVPPSPHQVAISIPASFQPLYDGYQPPQTSSSYYYPVAASSACVFTRIP